MLVHAIDIIIDLGVVRVISYYYYKQTDCGYQNVSYIYLYRSFDKNRVTNIAVDNSQSTQHFQYTCTCNQLVLASVPLLLNTEGVYPDNS